MARGALCTGLPTEREFAFHGEFLELDPPRRRVSTWVWEGAPEATATETFELEAVEGGTLLRMKAVHSSVANRDMHVANGMEGGIVGVLRPPGRAVGRAAS